MQLYVMKGKSYIVIVIHGLQILYEEENDEWWRKETGGDNAKPGIALYDKHHVHFLSW